MLEKMAAAKGIHSEETLTGFKWMANVAQTLQDSGYTVPFAFEEALGYMFPSVCYDKDGVTAAMVFLAAEAKWRSQGLTASAKLQALFSQFGHHETLNTYFRSPNSDLTMALFRGIRCGRYQKDMSLGAFKVQRWRDLTNGYDSGTSDSKPSLPVDKSSEMLTLWLDRDVRFTIRASGTEPKVKRKCRRAAQLALTVRLVYIESCGASRDQAVAAVCDTLSTVVEEWVRPFAPSMTYSKQLPTSSGHVFVMQ